MKPRRRRRRTLPEIWFGNIADADAAGDTAPPVRIPRQNTPRSMPERTGEFRPVRQSAN